MLSKVFSAAIEGLDSYPVEIEADVANGLPAISIVGLPDASIKESKDRVKSAIVNSGFKFPVKRITINLAPADTKKQGSSFDLAIAIAILIASEQIQVSNLDKFIILGELSLEGKVRSVQGILPMALLARNLKPARGLLIPKENTLEASVVDGLKIYSIPSLTEAIQVLKDPDSFLLFQEPINWNSYELEIDNELDFSDVQGQASIKRALEVAAAGFHNFIMIGPPGSGKSMLAKRIPSILPPMSLSESLETTKIYSVLGLLPENTSLIMSRPFRSPHHTISDAGLIGGGMHPRPGEVSMAHHGVLFLDELPEFKRNVLEVLRQPIEEKKVSIARASGSLTYPASFMLVAAMNPCPCGFLTDPRKECRCTPIQIQKYISKISGPLLDRIDIQVEVPPVPLENLKSGKEYCEESSEMIRKRVIQCREIQFERFKNKKYFSNSHISARDIERLCAMTKEARRLLLSANKELGLSVRAYHKIQKVARTIADLAQSEIIDVNHIAEAVQYRSLDRSL